MKYLKTKHERNSAKVTGLIILIVALLLFVVGSPYKEIPDEYGVAINFSDASKIQNSKSLDNPSKSESKADNLKSEQVQIQEIDKAIEEFTDDIPAQDIEEQKALEQAENEEIAKLEAAKQEEAREEAEIQKAAEALLAQQEEEALHIKEAKEKAEVERLEKERKETIEAQRIAEAIANEEREAKEKRDRALKAESARIAKVKAEKEAREQAQRDANAKAERERLAKDKAVKDAKERAERAAAKAVLDKKAAAAAENNKRGGSDIVGFALIEEAPIYPGCEGLNNESRKNCMSTKLKQFVANNFDSELASSLGLTANQKITIYFKISKTGQIIDIRAKATDPKLEEEAKRVTNLLPKLKPGIQQGKPVTVPYALPIRFKTKE